MDDDDRKQREKPGSEIAQIASAFLEPEDLERMGVAEREAATATGSKPDAPPTNGALHPKDMASSTTQPETSNATSLVNDDGNATNTDADMKNVPRPPSPGDDAASNGSSCSKRWDLWETHDVGK